MTSLSVKERIIETASDLFYNQGYKHTGINQVIAEANVAKASLYKYFKSKEDIAITYLKNTHEDWMRNLNTFIKDKQTPYARLLAAFDYLQEWLDEVNYVGCSFQNIVTNLPKSEKRIYDLVLFHKNEVKNWITNNLKETNKYNEIELNKLSNEFMVLMEGAIISSQIQKNSVPVESAKRIAETLILY